MKHYGFQWLEFILKAPWEGEKKYDEGQEPNGCRLGTLAEPERSAYKLIFLGEKGEHVMKTSSKDLFL